MGKASCCGDEQDLAGWMCKSIGHGDLEKGDEGRLQHRVLNLLRLETVESADCRNWPVLGNILIESFNNIILYQNI